MYNGSSAGNAGTTGGTVCGEYGDFASLNVLQISVTSKMLRKW